MAFAMGKDGDFKFGTTEPLASSTMTLDSFSINPSFNTADVSAYGNKTKVNAQTLAEWTAEASGTLDLANTTQAALLDQFKLGAGGGGYFKGYTQTKMGSSAFWHGSVILTGTSIGSTVGDKVTVSFSFACNGDLKRT